MSIVEYTDREEPTAEYPERIVSPPSASTCCVEANRERVGGVEAEEGETYFYKRCRVCGHTVRFFFTPRYKSTSLEARILEDRQSATLH